MRRSSVMKLLSLVLTTTLGGTVLLQAGCAFYRVEQGRNLVAASSAFSVAPPDAEFHLLLVGDSTAVGTGASSPRTSVAGRLSAKFPRMSIVNLGVNGAVFTDVVKQLTSAPTNRFDAVLILAGGNDVLRITAEGELRADVNAAADRAAEMAPLVIFMPSGNVGNAPFFSLPFSWLKFSLASLPLS